MSRRPGAPYHDKMDQGGRTIIYEGHDLPRSRQLRNPKKVDQPEFLPSGRPTQNGLFARAGRDFRDGLAPAELVHVYEKLREGIWVYNGLFELTDAWQEVSGHRSVFKFRLEIVDNVLPSKHARLGELEHDRVIPSGIKLEVWKRDKGRCTKCGAADNLHFDHIIPYSLGGSSKDSKNIQLLCARHNIQKRDTIE